MSSTSSERLGLLLADVHGRPMLEQGLDEGEAGRAPKPARGPKGMDALTLEAPDADPNDLPAQRWGIVAPEGPEGDAILEALAPLLSLRESEQDAPLRPPYRVPPDMDVDACMRWKNTVLRDEKVPEAERPKYLLMVGDLDRVSAELQLVLANGTFVGRLALPSGDAYAAYARKVARWARASACVDKPDALFFAAGDGTETTDVGNRFLVEQCRQMADASVANSSSSSRHKRNQFQANQIVMLDRQIDAGGLISATVRDAERPSILLSLSHGAGQPRSMFAPEVRRAEQGALVLGGTQQLSAASLPSGPFLPGGFWFMVACFGAGTPRSSAFYPWLAQLARQDAYEGRLYDVLACLPDERERPFVAALPQAALAKDDGPLAVVGHLDLAWTYAFTDGQSSRQGRASRVFSSLQAASRGSRAGVALDALMRSYREVNDELIAGYEVEEEARVWKRTFDPDLVRRGQSYMLRNDLRGYVLLGDPAARLPLSGMGATTTAPRTPSVSTSKSYAEPTTPATSASMRDPKQMEEAVLAVLRGEEGPRAIAARHQVSRDVLDEWVKEYREAGRERLAKLR